MNSFSVTWTNEKRVRAAARRQGGNAGDGGHEEDEKPPHATSLMRGIFPASGTIRAASTPNHCSTSDA